MAGYREEIIRCKYSALVFLADAFLNTVGYIRATLLCFWLSK